jgi:hypothetical protein
MEYILNKVNEALLYVQNNCRENEQGENEQNGNDQVIDPAEFNDKDFGKGFLNCILYNSA